MTFHDPAWADGAPCRTMRPPSVDPDEWAEVFFGDPTPNVHHDYTQAKAICAECTLHDKCRELYDTLKPKHRKHGVWFGTTPAERSDEATPLTGRVCTECEVEFTARASNATTCGADECLKSRRRKAAASPEARARQKLRNEIDRQRRKARGLRKHTPVSVGQEEGDYIANMVLLLTRRIVREYQEAS